MAELGFTVCFWITPFVNRKNVVDMHGIQPWPSKNFGPAALAGHLVQETRTGRPQATPPYTQHLFDAVAEQECEGHKRGSEGGHWRARGPYTNSGTRSQN